MGLAILVLGLAVFIAGHALTMARGVRAACIGQIGEGPYKIAYSLVSLLGIVLIVWGYSLPATDFYAEYLFRSAPTGRKKRIGDLIVVNPNQQIAEKFKSLFRPKRLAWHANIDKYFEAENII